MNTDCSYILWSTTAVDVGLCAWVGLNCLLWFVYCVADPGWFQLPETEQDDLLERIQQDNTREKVKRCIVKHSQIELQQEIGHGGFNLTTDNYIQL